MKNDDNCLLIMVKQELGGVESSLHQVDGLVNQAMEDHDPEKLKKYMVERSALIESRDKLQREIERVEAEFKTLHDREKNAIATAWEALKNALDDFRKKHGQ